MQQLSCRAFAECRAIQQINPKSDWCVCGARTRPPMLQPSAPAGSAVEVADRDQRQSLAQIWSVLGLGDFRPTVRKVRAPMVTVLLALPSRAAALCERISYAFYYSTFNDLNIDREGQEGGATGRCFSVEIKAAALRELAIASPTATHNIARNPEMNDSRTASCSAGPLVSIAASLERCASMSARTAGNRSRRFISRSRELWNVVLSNTPNIATANNAAIRETALLIPEAT